MKVFKNLLPYLVIIILVVLIVTVLQAYLSTDTLTMTEFVRELDANNVEEVELEKFTAQIKLKKPIKGSEAKDYKLTVISYDKFEELMIEAGRNEEITGFNYSSIVKEIPFIVNIIPYILMIIVVVFFIIIFLNQGNAGANKILNFGKSRARIYTTSKISFADVAGAEEEKEELMELVSFLKNPKRYSNLGARIPKGVLMVGPPGTGKTYLAKAVAGEAGVPFFSISGSDFVEMYVGVGASRVRDLFEQAKKNNPCIIFIDEIDAVGRHRGAGLGGGHDEREQTLNQLLVEMDGFGVNEGVIMIAATNRPDILDPALTRPGRFDRKIAVGYPDIRARELVLKVHSRNKPIAQDVNFSDVAKNTSGFTPADLENLMNEAALLAARDKKEKITNEDIKEATFKVVLGPEKRSLIMTEEDKKLTAFHEAGHAIAVKMVSSTNKVDRISIIPTGMAGGYTASRPEEDRDYVTKSQLEEEIIVALAGKAAEEISLNEISTGSVSDLKRANSIALNMVAKYGMSDELGNMIMDTGSNEVFIGRDLTSTRSVSEETAALVDKEVRKIIDIAYKKAIEVLKDNIDKLNELADRLLEVEKIEREEFEEIMAS